MTRLPADSWALFVLALQGPPRPPLPSQPAQVRIAGDGTLPVDKRDPLLRDTGATDASAVRGPPAEVAALMQACTGYISTGNNSAR